MAVTLSGSVVSRYDRFSLYNSPYPAHDQGCAIDLYPDGDTAVSPVGGEVLDVRTVRCPPREYACDRDHLILIDRGADVARILHVHPDVDAGDEIAVGDSLGRLVRSGFFGRWVDNHIHLGFREYGQNVRRASGSLPLSVDVSVSPIAWDGTGTVVETGATYVRLDTPAGNGDGFAALGSDEGVPLDGGLVHYAGGGALSTTGGTVSLLGTPIGTANGRDVAWADVSVYANGVQATGLSLFASRVPFGAKLVFHEGHEFAVGDSIEVTVEPTADPIGLG